MKWDTASWCTRKSCKKRYSLFSLAVCDYKQLHTSFVVRKCDFTSLSKCCRRSVYAFQKKKINGMRSGRANRLDRLRTGVGRFRSCLYKWGMWVWHRRTNCRPCCPPMSNPSTSSWTARPDGSGQWDNRMAAQHLPRDLVQPSSGLNN